MTDVKSEVEEGLTCIWAEAGVLSYRLCDRHYECEGCPLFAALSGARQPAVSAAGPGEESPRGEPEAPSTPLVSAYIARLLSGCALRLDRTYSAGHWWLDESRPREVTVGLEEHVLRVLAPIDDIVTPRRGASLRRSEACAWLLRGRTAVPLAPPIAGRVEEVNRRYADSWRVWGALPWGDEWLMRVAPEEDVAAVPGLYRGEAALTWHLKNLQVVRETLRDAIESGGAREVGATLADGGEPNLDLERVLGHTRFDALVAALFPTPSS
jgi:glycine cleavage system H lipoate-binding protein